MYLVAIKNQLFHSGMVSNLDIVVKHKNFGDEIFLRGVECNNPNSRLPFSAKLIISISLEIK